ncbi:MAG: glycosyltransferase [Planctomycetes bacterium]|nr:glycosyltransferase [Planctomycetota bacterium]
MNRPTVSIVVPTYNRAELLPRALESIIGQTYGDWEIILVDDGSTDETPALADDYARRLGDRFVCLRQANAGSSAARNAGIDASRGRFLAFLDSDDEYLPNKLERQLRLFELCPDLGLVYCDFAFIDDDGIRHESVFDTKTPLAREVPFTEVEPGLCICGRSLFDYLIRGYFIATIVGLVRRDVLSNSIRFPVGISYAEEWLFYLKIARTCPAGFVNEPLCLHHFVQGSLARTDKHSNTLRQRELLLAIKASFADLAPAHHRAVSANLGDTTRQLGFDAYRAGAYRQAAKYFAESFKFQAHWGTAWDWAHALARWMVKPWSAVPQPRPLARSSGPR